MQGGWRTRRCTLAARKFAVTSRRLVSPEGPYSVLECSAQGLAGGVEGQAGDHPGGRMKRCVLGVLLWLACASAAMAEADHFLLKVLPADSLTQQHGGYFPVTINERCRD